MRHRAFVRRGGATESRWRRGLQGGAVALALLLALAGSLGLGQQASRLPARTNMGADMPGLAMPHPGG